MKNFQFLDHYFPTGEDRNSGEVVGLTVNIPGGPIIFRKEKAWYRNASANAERLFRGLLADLAEAGFGALSRNRLFRRCLRHLVGVCYLRGLANDEQYFEAAWQFFGQSPQFHLLAPDGIWVVSEDTIHDTIVNGVPLSVVVNLFSHKGLSYEAP